MGDSAEPKVKKYYVTATRDAIVWAWGQGGLADVASRMPPRDREEVFADALPPWVRLRSVIAMGFGIWEGPARRSRATYFRFLHKTTDMSFGVVRKTLLAMATPEKIILMAGELWKSDHTHGSWETSVEDKRGRLVLRGNPFTETPHARTSLAEQIRYIVQLTGAQGVTASHGLMGADAFEIIVRWK